MLMLMWPDKKTGEMQKLRFDVVSSESYEEVMAITSHPVEEGANIVDHARPEHTRLTIEGYVSNKPIYSNPDVEKYADFGKVDLYLPPEPAFDVQSVDLEIPPYPSPFSPTPGGLTRTVTGLVDNLLHPAKSKATLRRPKGVVASRFAATALRAKGDFPDRAKAIYERLLAAKDARAFIRVISKLTELDNLLIERVACPRKPEDGNGATFEVDLVRVRVVKSETVAAPEPAEARGAKLTSKGSKSAKKSPEEEKKEEVLRSTAVGIVDGAAAGVGRIVKLAGGG